MREHASGDPAAYARFSSERSRPFADLVAQVRTEDPALVVDLGCGHGPATLTLAQLWPDARVVGVDASEAMLESARELDREHRVEWVQADLREWDPASLGQAPDVVVTSSTLQWVPGHLDLLDSWVGALAAGGWFALQVPGNFDAPSHRLMRETAEHHERAGELGAALDLPAVGEPATYLRYLTRLGCTVDAWETTYLRARPRPRGGEPRAGLGGRDRTAAGPRHPHRRRGARRVRRPVCRGARRGLPPARRRACCSPSGGSSPSPAGAADPGAQPGRWSASAWPRARSARSTRG